MEQQQKHQKRCKTCKEIGHYMRTCPLFKKNIIKITKKSTSNDIYKIIKPRGNYIEITRTDYKGPFQIIYKQILIDDDL